ncbi:hypothetical protein RO3G_07533 [Lichtheimia corymbifera JMRC:FSU:9682]|uniref:DUF7137 domain-containing protein n=1 Tax=Lichtheimia corymbifera JMRC:FSU:9682 TaxID=1263082 RepID=A0A068RFN9_9FUNG|nr:hypothetical protein RO3G_07533 [Lichtheimia corymbifera JMRC:FSU:9682]
MKRVPQAEGGQPPPAASGDGQSQQQPQQSAGGGDQQQQQPSAAPAQPSGSGAPASSGANPPNTAPQQGGNNTAAQSSGGQSGIGGLPTSGSFGNTIYPGTVTFIEPTGSKSVSPLYRIDSRENVTFRWEFQSLRVRPVNLTLAAVGPQSATYTIAQLDGAATSAVWHLSDVPAETPLFNGMYQIQLYDQRGVSAHPDPGYLAPATRLTIAFYNPESYGPMSGSDYCPRCFYDAAQRIGHSFTGLGIAFGIACVTSVFFIYGILN